MYNYIVFRSSRRRVELEDLYVRLNEDVIPRVDCTKFLGVIIDEQLTWKPHITYIQNKLPRTGIHGVKETTGESTDNLIRNLAKEKLNVDIKPENIDRSHRIGMGGKSDKKGRPLHRPIIAKFAGYGPRSLIYSARSKLRSTGIYIHENLTNIRQKLLKKVKVKYSQPDQKVWTQDGKVKTDNRMFTIASKTDWTEHCERFRK